MINPTDKLVEAFLQDERGEKFLLGFRVSNIDYLRTLSETSSAIVLNSGLGVPVNLSYADLKKRIYDNDFKSGSEIDLKEETGMRALLSPTAVFNQSAAAGQPSVSSRRPLMISALLREYGTSIIARVEFSEDDIRSAEPSSSTNTKGGYGMKILFNAAVNHPFNISRGIFLDMPHDDFQAYLLATKRTGAAMLDLCEVFASKPNAYGYKP